MVNTDLVEVPSAVRTSTFKVRAAAPPQIDLTTIHHFDQSRLYTNAIYRLKGNVLTYCVGAPGQPRPTTFATRPGDGNTLVVLQRAPSQ